MQVIPLCIANYFIQCLYSIIDYITAVRKHLCLTNQLFTDLKTVSYLAKTSASLEELTLSNIAG